MLYIYFDILKTIIEIMRRETIKELKQYFDIKELVRL